MLTGERGVTLIELIVALAIAGLLAFSVLFGRDQLLANQQFSQGVDQVVETLSSARNQATTTVGSTAASGGTSSEYTYAKTVEYATNGTITVATETINCLDPTCVTSTVATPARDTYKVNIPWGVHPAPSNVRLWFGLQNGGTVKAYTTAGSFPAAGGDKNAGLPAIGVPTVVANLVDSHGNHATITIDQFGNITRQIL